MAKPHKKVANKHPDGSVSLKVCKDRHSRPKPMQPSRVGRIRAGVLIGVYLLMIGHLAWWLYAGKTISPIEPSESMQTLEQGLLNAGFVFFSLALLATLLFGRFVCGWGCHIVALQDLCRWMMLKIGIRPKPFRSRLLILAPLTLALYMFIWPNFKRFALFPALDAIGIDRPVWLKPVAPFNGFETAFIVPDFWATFPPWYVAIPFFLVVGFAAVYFLGAKGFCTYGCPYGGFFAVVDKLSPFRIRVTDACEGCGHCTASCSSNVRVHEEVREFGMVVDPGCMKCLDCISVCPNDALYLGFGKPATFAKPKNSQTWQLVRQRRNRMLDATLFQELIVAVVFLSLFIAYRGMLGQVPMLMAIGMAAIGAFAFCMLLRLFRDPNARVQQLQLKLKGKIRPAGWLFAALTVGALAAAAWSATVRYHRWRGDMLHAKIDIPAEIALLPDYIAPPQDRARAQHAIAHYTIADAPAHGGFGWALNPDELVRVAYLQLVLHHPQLAEQALQQVVAVGHPTDALVFELAGVMRARGADENAVAEAMRDTLRLHPDLHAVRREIALREQSLGAPAEAEKFWDAASDDLRNQPAFWVERTRYWLILGSASRALDALGAGQSILRDTGKEGVNARLDLAEMAVQLNARQKVESLTDAAAAFKPLDPNTRLRLAGLFLQTGRIDEGRTWLNKAVASDSTPLGPLLTAAKVYLQLDEAPHAQQLLERALARAHNNPWELITVGAAFAEVGNTLQQPALIDKGVSISTHAFELKPDSPALAERVALILANTHRLPESADWMAKAAALNPTSARLADRTADLYAHADRPDDAARWKDQAAKRKAAASHAP